MNRKTGLLLLSAIEMLLLIVLVALFTSGKIGMTAFIAAVVAIGLVSSAVIFVIIKKTHGQ